MTLQQGVLGLYKLGLHLYPREFRDLYAADMQMVAEDILANSTDARQVMRAAISLNRDLLITVTKAQTKHLGEFMKNQTKQTTPSSMRAAAITALQVVGVAVTGLAVIYANVSTYQTIQQEYAQGSTHFFVLDRIVSVTLPVLAIILAYVLLRKSTTLSHWHKTVTSCAVGATAMAGYIVCITLTPHIYSPVAYAKNSGWVDALIGLAILAGIYGIVPKLGLASNRKPNASK